MKFKKGTRGFTLLELLIVIGILAILATTAILVLNPAELLKRSRDSSRISDLSTIKSALAIAITDNTSISLGVCDGTKVYVSIPSETPLSSAALEPSGVTLVQVPQANLGHVDGTGWIPVNLTNLSINSPLGSWPVDPLNTANTSDPALSYFYTYGCNSSAEFELNAKLESGYYGFKDRDGFPIANPASNDLPLKQGHNGYYAVGTNLNILPKGSQCPAGMVWVPSPGKFCIDAYEATYAATSTKVDGTACSANCPVSTYNTSPWSSVQAPAPSQTQAITLCANMGKVLPDDFSWWLAAAGTPDANTQPADNGPCQIWNSGAWPNYSGIKPNGSSWAQDNGWGASQTAAIKTGTATQCKSVVGAYDMIGNLWEWTNNTIVCNGTTCTYNGITLPAEGYINSINNQGIPLTTGGASTTFNNDYLWENVAANTYGFLRAANWSYGWYAGRFALNLGGTPGTTDGSVGFRCLLR